MVATIAGCEKDLVARVLFNDAGLDLVHQIGKAVLCFLRDGCDCCGLHDDLELDVCNLVDDAGLVEIECATR